MYSQLQYHMAWQQIARRNHQRLYRGGMVRRALLTERVTGRVLASIGRRLEAVGDWLQGDEIAAPPLRTAQR